MVLTAIALYRAESGILEQERDSMARREVKMHHPWTTSSQRHTHVASENQRSRVSNRTHDPRWESIVAWLSAPKPDCSRHQKARGDPVTLCWDNHILCGRE